MPHNKSVQKEYDKAFGAALEANGFIGATRGSDIERRGTSLPGDTGQNFGQNYFYRQVYNQLFPGQFGQYYGSSPFGAGLNTYFGGSFTNSNVLENRTHVAHSKMALAAEAYRGFGVIKNVIDLMCNFASEGITIQHKRPAIRKFYQRWAEIVDLPGRVKDILRQYYKFGNVFIYTTYGTIDEKAYQRMRSARGIKVKADTMDPNMVDRVEDAEEEADKPISERLIPWRYTLLNPFQMHLDGEHFFGETKWKFKLDYTTKVDTATQAESPYIYDDTKVNLPKEFKDAIKDKSGYVVLDQKRLWTMHYMKDDHEDWADPLIWPVIGDVIYKNKLRAMDISVCESAISAVTIFKLGNLKEGFIAPPEHFRKFAEMLRTPTHAMTMVWNDAIDVVSSYPPVEKILGVQKYEAVDADILKGLGIPEILMGGKGGNFSNSFVSVRTLLERLEEGRAEVLKWINKQLRLIATIMGHRDIPTVVFGQMSLRDENAEKQLILGLLDRGVISIEAVHEIFGQNFEIERERLKNENDIRDKEGIFIQRGPFVDPLSDLTEDEKLDKQHKQQKDLLKNKESGLKEKPAEIKKNGRPVGTKNIKHKKKRETKPKGMASAETIARYETIKSIGQKIYSNVESLLTEMTVTTKGVKYKKALSQEDKDALDGLTNAVFCAAQPSTVIDKDFILAAIAVYDKVPIITGETSKISSIEERRDTRIRNWALHYLERDSDD